MRLTHMRRCIEVVLTTDLKYFLPKILLVEVATMAIYCPCTQNSVHGVHSQVSPVTQTLTSCYYIYQQVNVHV